MFDSLNPYFSELVVSESATVTIENNDAATISMAPVIGLSLEPDSGTDNQIYTVSTSAPIEGGSALGTLSVSLSGTAQEGGTGLGSNDYDENSTSTTLSSTWDSLTTPTIVDVNINGDTVVELDETIVMTLDALPTGLTGFELDNGSDAITVIDGVAVHTITNEDSATITVNDVTGAEALLACLLYTSPSPRDA